MKLLKFGAEWCGPCRMLDQKLEDFTLCEVEKIDISDDENEELCEKYKVRNIPVTVALDDNGNEIKRWVGVFDLDEVKQLI